MAFDERRFQRFAVAAEIDVRRSLDFQPHRIDVDRLGAALGYSPDEARAYAIHLRSKGWANIGQDAKGHWLELTTTGREEISWRMLPAWKRLIKMHALGWIVAAVIATVCGIISGIITNMATR